MPSSAPRTVRDYYAILGVDRDATTQDIKKAFRKIARECHPDVAGDQPGMRERFEEARKAYEVLVDPVERSRYDRRRQPRSDPFGGGFPGMGGFGGFAGFAGGGDGGAGFHASSKPGNDIGLEDIFNDFGAFDDFGFGGGSPGGPGAPGGPAPGASPRADHGPPPPRSPHERARSKPRTDRPGEPERPPPLAGQDINLKVHVPADIAARGGLVTLQYQRLKRSDDGRALESYDEIHDLRVPPDTQHGDTLRVPRFGHASMTGLPGELVCDVIIDGGTHAGPSGSDERARAPRPTASDAPTATGTREDPVPLPVSVSEALLGGRVELEVPGGTVRLVVPPCTSSGALLRLRGKNQPDPQGPATDLYLEVQVIMPSSLDERSRELILEFARLNSFDPRS
jgi:molecular chaperone DnaJ